MSISSIAIVENNFIESIDLLSVHNPLIFVVRATYTNPPPDYLFASIEGLEDADYKCIYLRDESATERDFYFIADEVLRNFLGGIADFDQSDETTLAVSDLAIETTIHFTDDGVEGEQFDIPITIMIANVSRDFENVNGACLVDLYNNESLTYIGALNQQMYAYWYNNDAANIIDGVTGIDNSVDANTTAANARTYLATAYSTWINNADGLKDVWCYYFPSPPSTQLILEASNGASIYFYDIGLPLGTTSAIGGNGTTSARLILKMTSNPATGSYFDFKFTSDLTAMPIEGYVRILEPFGISVGDTFPKGFIRKAISPTDISNNQITTTIDGTPYTHNLSIRNWCDGDVMLKYLDRNGQYRFMPFSRNYSRTSNPQSIGSINELILSLATDKSDSRNIGFNNNDTLRLSAYMLNETELALMKDLYNSKDIQIYLNKWLRVEIEGDNISELEKRKFTDISITVRLPKSYNITEL